MDTVVLVLKVLFTYFVLLFLGTNLVGGIVKGLYISSLTGQGVFRPSVIYTLILGIYLGAVYYFFNVWVLLAALLIIVGRTPDQIWEIKNGQKLATTNMPKTLFNYILLVLMWAALPLLWFAFK
jgi:hypothetical protein